VPDPPTGTESRSEKESQAIDDAAERLPADVDGEVLRKHFTLTDADFAQVALCRGASNKLGFSLQLCTLRWRGHFLGDVSDAPAVALQVLAPQLGLLPMPLADYPPNDKTRAAHFERIRQISGLCVALGRSASACSTT
jgi:Domain of unknown function (DUF4158)